MRSGPEVLGEQHREFLRGPKADMGLRHLISYFRAGTYCPQSDHTFAEHNARAIAAAIARCRPTTLCVGGYTPPYEAGEFPQGFLTLDFWRNYDSKEWCSLGIEFGQTDAQGQPVRYPFDPIAWAESPNDPTAGMITALNFDEAWRIVCLVGKYTRVQTISLAYGY